MVLLPRQHRELIKSALLDMGISPTRAEDLATLARRSFGAFRRRLASNPELQTPIWARASADRSMRAAMLAGAWNDDNQADRGVLSRLSGMPYEDFSRALVVWENTSDPPVRHDGNVRMVASKHDALVLMARLLTIDDLVLFESCVLETLRELNPALDRSQEERWMAGMLGVRLEHSSLLRQGLADTLALMGAVNDSVEFADGSRGQALADRVVRRILDTNEWKAWSSLAPVLPLLAEASPSMFLDAVESKLLADPSLTEHLFVESNSALSPSSPHTELLWALELIAWHPDYTSRAIMQLAKLSIIDPYPDSRLINRPARSLREIILPWSPQTLATFDQRLRIVDAIRQRFPDVAWTLMVNVLPTGHDISHPTHKPSYREWLPDEPSPVTNVEYNRFIHEIVTRLVQDVGLVSKRWVALINATTRSE
jgi:hypothetical protein